MSHAGSGGLKGRAQELLRNLGFKLRSKTLPGCHSHNVFCYEVGGTEEFVLIQCRSRQDDTDRYLVGIMMEALSKVDSVVLYFDREGKVLKLPADFLRQIHAERVQIGDAKYTGDFEEQWRINVFLNDEKLSPQGSYGDPYDIGPYVINIAPNQQVRGTL